MVAGGGEGRKGHKRGWLSRSLRSLLRSAQPTALRSWSRSASTPPSPTRRYAPRGSYCACSASLHRLALHSPTGAVPGAPLRVCFRRLCYGTDCRLCHRSKLRPSEATSALMSVPDCLCCQHHQQKVIASRHEFDMCPLNSTIPPRASVGSPGFLCPYAYWGELTCRAVLDAGYCSRVTAGTSRCLRIVYVLRYRLTPACGLLPVSLSSRSRSCLVVCNCV